MKIAIVERQGTFSDGWIKYCQENEIAYKIVDPYRSDIIQQVEGCDAFMWHHHHADYKDVLFAKQLLYSLQQKGLRVYPDFNSVWHFDDKVGQKYLLESIGAPLVPSFVFYRKSDALAWIEQTSFPKVFKLRGGASGSNVKLATTARKAKALVNRAFGKGFPQFNRIGNFKEHARNVREGREPFTGLLRGLARMVVIPEYARMHPREKGYAYFQEFIPGNQYDTRVVVIGGERALGERRYCRPGDFRASGSGRFEYVQIDKCFLKIAFEIARKLKLQTVAFDFIYDRGTPLVIEMSYGFGTHGISHCGGYYTTDFVWHEDKNLNFYGWMIEMMK